MAIQFQDTFTDANGTLIGGGGATPQGHVPDQGSIAAYMGNSQDSALGASATVQTNRARCAIGSWVGGQPFSDYHILTVAELNFSPGNMKEFYFDVFPISTVTGSIIELIFQHKSPLILGPTAEYCAIHLRKVASGNWEVYGSYGPYQFATVPPPYLLSAPRFSPLLATVVMADAGAGLRFGATRYQNTRLYDIWREPAGGGTRTLIGSFTFPNYDDATHKLFGFAWTGPQSATTTFEIDGLITDGTGTEITGPPPVFASARSMEVVGFATHANVTGLAAQFIRGNRGFLGIATNTPTWLSDIKRWVRPATSSGIDTILGTSTNPHPVPVYLKSGSPSSKWVLVDEMRVRRTAGVGAKSAFFGVGRFSGGALLRETVGFSSVASGTAAANWFAKVQADDGSVPISVDLGVSDAALHELMLVLNGITREIEWYIDRVRKHKAALPAGVGGMLNVNEPHVGTRLTSPDATNTIILDSEMYGTGGLILVER